MYLSLIATHLFLCRRGVRVATRRRATGRIHAAPDFLIKCNIGSFVLFLELKFASIPIHVRIAYLGRAVRRN